MKPALALLVPAALLVTACASPGKSAFQDGVALYREGYYASARDAFETSLRETPALAAGWNNRASTRARLGDLDGALQDYTRAMELAPADAEIVFNRGNVYAALGNLPAAIADYTAAVSMQPVYARALFNRGTVRAAMGDTAGALADWQRAIEVEPDPWAKAAMRRGSGVDTVAVAPAASVIAVVSPPGAAPAALSPLDVRALVARAMSREMEGDRGGALADLRSALAAERDPARRARIDHLLRALESPR